jgi:glycosyltransferase involved in cell wall biosynthesis
MHIAHFTNTYKPNINGVVRSVSTFRDALMRLGHQVFVFAQESHGYEDTEPFIFRYPGIEVPRYDYSFTLPVSPFIDWVLPALKPDIIHSNHPVLLGQVAAEKAEKHQIPLVFTFHTRFTQYSYILPFSQVFIQGMMVDWLARYIERCQHIITPSDNIRQMLANYGGVIERVTTIPTGINLVPYQEADGSFIRSKFGLELKRVLVTNGRLSMEKNWKTLLAAAALVFSKYDDVRLLMIGDGPLRRELEDYMEELGIRERVIITGLVPFEDIPAHLKAGDIYCFASVSETQGLVTMEAMAAGLPVVAVRATGSRDVVEEGVQGLLTQNDSSALARAILHLLDDSTLRSRLRLAAVEKARSFDSMIQAEKMLDVYSQAIEDQRASRFVKIDRRLLKEKRRQFGRSLASG